MARKKLNMTDKLLSFDDWTLQTVKDVQFEERCDNERDAWRFVVEKGLAALGKKRPDDSDS